MHGTISFAPRADALTRIDVLPPSIPLEIAAMATAYGLDCTFEELRRLGRAIPVDDYGSIAAGRGCWLDPDALEEELSVLAGLWGWQAAVSDLLLDGDPPDTEDEDDPNLNDEPDDDHFDDDFDEPDDEPFDDEPYPDDGPDYDDDDWG